MDVSYPAAPEILVNLLKVENDIQTTANLIATDAELSKELLATINAPYFALVRDIQNPSEATLLLGSKRVLNLATARLLRKHFFSTNTLAIQEVWKTSLKVAIIGVLVAKELNKACTDEVYAASLFQNVGMAVLLNQAPEYMKVVKNAYLEPNSQISESEIASLGICHAQISSEVAKRWGLDQVVFNAIRHHHSPEQIIRAIKASDPLGELLLVMKVSEHIARLPGYLVKTTEDYEWQQIKDCILDELVLTEGMFRRIEHTIKKKLSEIKS